MSQQQHAAVSCSQNLEGRLLELQNRGNIPRCSIPSRSEMLQGLRPVCHLKTYMYSPLGRMCTNCRRLSRKTSVVMHYQKSVERRTTNDDVATNYYNGTENIDYDLTGLQRLIYQQSAAITQISNQAAHWRLLFLQAQQRLVEAGLAQQTSHVPSISDGTHQDGGPHLQSSPQHAASSLDDAAHLVN